MLTILFWIFSVLMLASAVAVILFRNPVNSAMSLVLSFLALAALFITLDAFFIGIIQVLVYAGAVMVLFLFIIMLLDFKAETRRKLNIAALAGVLLRRNLLIIFMGLELMLNAANLSLVAFARHGVTAFGLPDYNAQVLVFFIITVAAAEVAVGLAIIVALFRLRQTTHVEDLNQMKS